MSPYISFADFKPRRFLPQEILVIPLRTCYREVDLVSRPAWGPSGRSWHLHTELGPRSAGNPPTPVLVLVVGVRKKETVWDNFSFQSMSGSVSSQQLSNFLSCVFILSQENKEWLKSKNSPSWATGSLPTAGSSHPRTFCRELGDLRKISESGGYFPWILP